MSKDEKTGREIDGIAYTGHSATAQAAGASAVAGDDPETETHRSNHAEDDNEKHSTSPECCHWISSLTD